jgi:hypothetical protein
MDIMDDTTWPWHDMLQRIQLKFTLDKRGQGVALAHLGALTKPSFAPRNKEAEAQ